MQLFGHRVFGAVPVVLAAQGSRGAMRYYGRKDIVSFLSKTPAFMIPWKQYTVAA